MQETVFNVLDKVLGPFVHGLDRQSLNLSVWSGDIRLQGLQLRTHIGFATIDVSPTTTSTRARAIVAH